MKRKVNDGSPLLLPKEPLQILPSLAVAIGLAEAIVLQQLHYWLRRSEHHIDGLPWIYNSYIQWQGQFPFWSPDTIKRAILHLERLKIVISTARFNRNPIDKTKWYRIDYRRLNEFCASSTMQIAPSTGQNASSTMQIAPSTGQIAPMDDANCPHGRCKLPSLPETSTETTTEKKPSPHSPPVGGPGAMDRRHPARARRRRKTYYPTDPEAQTHLRESIVDQSLQDWATHKGITLDLADQWEQFSRKAVANAYKYADWRAAFQNWLVSDYQATRPARKTPQARQQAVTALVHELEAQEAPHERP